MTQLFVAELRMGLVAFDYTFLFTFINALILFFIVKTKLFEPINKFMKEREAEIQNQYLQAENANVEANKLIDEYNNKLANAESEGMNIIKDYTNKANQKSQDIIASAEKEAINLKNKATKEIELEKQQAAHEIKNQLAELTILATSKLLSREIKDVDHEQLISQTIKSAGEAQW